MSQEQMNFMKVSDMKNFSTCKDVMKQINTKQKLLGEEHVSTIPSTYATTNRPTIIDAHRSMKLQTEAG